MRHKHSGGYKTEVFWGFKNYCMLFLLFMICIVWLVIAGGQWEDGNF